MKLLVADQLIIESNRVEEIEGFHETRILTCVKLLD